MCWNKQPVGWWPTTSFSPAHVFVCQRDSHEFGRRVQENAVAALFTKTGSG